MLAALAGSQKMLVGGADLVIRHHADHAAGLVARGLR